MASLSWQQVAIPLLKSLKRDLSQTGMVEPFFAPYRLKLVMAGERAGKSWTGASYGVVRHMAHMVATPDKPYLIWLVGKEYINCFEEFTQLAENYIGLGLLDPKALTIRDEGRQFCSFKLAGDTEGRHTLLTVETVSGGEPYKIQRVAPDGIIGCEVAQWTETLFERVIGRLVQKDGWLWASGSFESSHGWLVDYWNKWRGANEDDARSYSIPSWTNRYVFPDGENDKRIKAVRALYSDFLFQQRFMGIPAAPKGLVFDDFDPLTHVSTQSVYDPALPVYLFIDPGFKSAYAVLAVQLRDNTVHVVDELYERDKTHDDMIHMSRGRPWWRPDEFGRPSGVAYGVIDIAGTQHHATRSAEEVWAAAGLRTRYKKIRVEDSIDRVRSILRSRGGLGVPEIRIHPSCRGLIAEMGGGPAPWPDRQPWAYKTDRDGNVMSDVPDDKNNDACKALAYGCVEMFGFVVVPADVTGIVQWTTPRGPSWLDWGGADTELAEKQQTLLSGGATYLCQYKHKHEAFAEARDCRG